jgi:hypothetical protein
MMNYFTFVCVTSYTQYRIRIVYINVNRWKCLVK